LGSCISNYDHFVFTFSFCLVCYYAWFFIFLFSHLFILFFSFFSQDPVRFHYYVENFLLLFPIFLPTLYFLVYFILFILDSLFSFHFLSPELIFLALEGPIDFQPDFVLLKDSGNGSSSSPFGGGNCDPSEVPGTLYSDLLNYLEKLNFSFQEGVDSTVIPPKSVSTPYVSTFEIEPLSVRKGFSFPAQVTRMPAPAPTVPSVPLGSFSCGLPFSPNFPAGSFNSFYPHVSSEVSFNSPFPFPGSSHLTPLCPHFISFIYSLLYLPAVPTVLYVYYFGRVNIRMLPFPGPLYHPSRPPATVLSPMLRYHLLIYVDLILSPLPLTVPLFPVGYPVNLIPLCIYNGPVLHPHIFEEFSYVVSGMNPPSRPYYTLAV
jgi:hypothetical protein